MTIYTRRQSASFFSNRTRVDFLNFHFVWKLETIFFNHDKFSYKNYRQMRSGQFWTVFNLMVFKSSANLDLYKLTFTIIKFRLKIFRTKLFFFYKFGVQDNALFVRHASRCIKCLYFIHSYYFDMYIHSLRFPYTC
jgi:hypothetical protein